MIHQAQPVAIAQPVVSRQVDDESEPLDIVSRLRRHKAVFCATFLLALGLVGGIYAVAPRTYQGQASILLATEPVLRGDPTIEQRRGDQADLQSQAQVMASLSLLESVASQPTIAALIKKECQARQLEPIGRLKEILSPTDCETYESDKVAGAEYLQANLNVFENGRSRVATVGYSSPLKEAAQIVPNIVVAFYISEGLENRINSRSAAVGWLRSEIERVSQDLKDTESRIEAFHRQHDLLRSASSSLAAEQLALVDQQLANARAAQSDAAAQLGELVRSPADAPSTLQNNAINDIKHDISMVASQIAGLESIHGAAYPELVTLRKKQASLNARLNREIERVAASLRQTYSAATGKATALEQQLKNAKRKVAASTEAETEIASLQRHVEVQRELYVDLSKKIDALEIERRVLSGDARIISRAQYPGGLASPRKLPYVVGGLLLAVVASVGATLILDRADRTVRTKRNFERMAGVPVLTHLPALRSSDLASCRNVMTPGELQEATRQLFANCVLVHGDGRPRSILITSALPRDGKTFVTLSLAQFAARSGRRVLAIEGDLRRPDFERALSVRARKGVSDYLRGHAEFPELLLPGGVPGLDVITAGRPTVDSTELISNGRIVDLLSLAIDCYDLVLIDGPPTEVVADAYLLATQVDGVVFCARWGISDTRAVTQAIHQLSARGARVLGLAIDRVVARRLPLYEKHRGYGLHYSSEVG
jgi:succinoglycan biosynthesis transport protein ExoP